MSHSRQILTLRFRQQIDGLMIIPSVYLHLQLYYRTFSFENIPKTKQFL